MKQKNFSLLGRKPLASNNFLDRIFDKNQSYEWTADEEGLVTIWIENKGAFHWLMQKLLGKPRVSQVHLEVFGSFIWKEIDGRTPVFEIGQKVEEVFGKKAEPLYERLTIYLKQLSDCGFII